MVITILLIYLAIGFLLWFIPFVGLLFSPSNDLLYILEILMTIGSLPVFLLFWPILIGAFLA